jgi:hypothetical protein
VDILERLVSDFGKRRLLLFAGAGLSKNLGLPSWSELIDHLATELDFDREVFKGLGSYPMLAQFYKHTAGSLDTLISWMRLNWLADSIDLAGSECHRLITHAKFPVIYTTNYDHWLERSHEYWGKPYDRIVTGPDIVRAELDSTHIVKFHGDLDLPNTMVLTESDYFDRLSFEHELDIKLRADMQQYSLLFIGYSLADPNIRLILHRLAKFREKLRDPHADLCSYIFLGSENIVETALLRRWHIEPIISRELDQGIALKEFLEELLLGRIDSAGTP